MLVIHGPGDQYADAAPWLSSLDTCVRKLQRSVDSLTSSVSRSRRRSNDTASSILLLPLEYHGVASRALRDALQLSLPQQSHTRSHPAAAVRDGIEDTLGAALAATSPFFRDVVCKELSRQMRAQIAAVRRARPAFPAAGRVSIFAHSTGAIYALEMVRVGLLHDAVPNLDAVVFAGSPAPAYAALDTRLAADIREAVLAHRRRSTLRVFNVYHPMDPVSYRMEPWILNGALDDGIESAAELASVKDDTSTGGNNQSIASPAGSGVSVPTLRASPSPNPHELAVSGSQAVRPPVKVGRIDRKTLWQEAVSFWDNTVQSVLSSLFPHRVTFNATDAETVRASMHSSDCSNTDEDGTSDLRSGDPGKVSGQGQKLSSISSLVSDHQEINELRYRSRANYGAADKSQTMRRSKSYILEAAADDGNDVAIGSEVLLGDRIDYELHDGVGAYTVDMATNWAAVKAHGFYWRSLDVARILVDIAQTSRDLSPDTCGSPNNST